MQDMRQVMPFAPARSSMKCIRFDVCKVADKDMPLHVDISSMKCIRFDVCKDPTPLLDEIAGLLNEVHTF